jgi:hypothetical protein
MSSTRSGSACIAAATRDGEFVAHDACRLEHLTDRRGEILHAAADQLLQAGGNPIRGGLDRALDVPLLVAPDEQSAGDEVVDHVHHEQGVALGALVDARRQTLQRARRDAAEARRDVGADSAGDSRPSAIS